MTGSGVAGSFYYVFIPDRAELAVAHREHEPELGKQIRAGGMLDDWTSIEYRVHNGLVTDYLANGDAFRLCSEALREVIDRHRGNDDVIQWLPALVAEADRPDRQYWVLHFPEATDLVDVSRSVFSGGRLVKPYLDSHLLNGHQVVSFAHNSASLVVADDVKRAIQHARCTGVKFSRIPVA